MKIDCNTIEKLITPIVEAMGFTVWHIELHQAKRKTLLRIYVDVPAGSASKSVSVNDCGLISDQVGALLDVELPILGNYVLEVSSPGLERKLYKLEHYQKYIGSNIHLNLFKPQDEQRNFTGIIKEASDDTIKLLIDDEVMSFDLNNISKAKLY